MEQGHPVLAFCNPKEKDIYVVSTGVFVSRGAFPGGRPGLIRVPDAA